MPNNHVNASQSSSRTLPTTLCVGVALGNLRLIAAMNDLIDSFHVKSQAFGLRVTVGRTPRGNAGPVALGREFTTFAETLDGEVRTLEAVQRELWEHALGATAIDALQDIRTFVNYSSCMKGLAMTLSQICSDLRLMSADTRPERRALTPPPNPLNLPGEAHPAISPIATRIFEVQTMLIDATETLRFACIAGIAATPGVRRRDRDDGDDRMEMTRRSTRGSWPEPQAS
jgi:aspartate ammonia-lyase